MECLVGVGLSRGRVCLGTFISLDRMDWWIWLILPVSVHFCFRFLVLSLRFLYHIVASLFFCLVIRKISTTLLFFAEQKGPTHTRHALMAS
ncbi:hypothetical protein V8F33_004388 [Rhypophila sp. PSN 637]